MDNKELPDFDTLKLMAEREPEKLELLLRACVEDVIQRAPVSCRRRLLGLQFQVDAQRQMAKNPIDSCIRISKLMHETFEELRVALNDVTPPTEVENEPVVVKANVLRMKKH